MINKVKHLIIFSSVSLMFDTAVAQNTSDSDASKIEPQKERSIEKRLDEIEEMTIGIKVAIEDIQSSLGQVNEDEYNDSDDFGMGSDNDDNPESKPIKIDEYTLDLSAKDPKISVTNTSSNKRIIINIINMLPFRRDEYSIVTNKGTKQPKPFEKKYNTFLADLEEALVSPVTVPTMVISEPKQECEDKSLKAAIKKVKEATDETKSGYSEDLFQLKLNWMRVSDSSSDEVCKEEIVDAKSLYEQSRMKITVDLESGESLSMSIKRGKSIDTAFNYTVEPKQWMTHIGFSFIRNKDDRYYSQSITEDDKTTYILSPQKNAPDWKHAATVLFTYPMWNEGKNVEWGLTAGVGASSDNVMALAGISAIIGKNFIISAGGTITQFERLKGVYYKGQKLGEKVQDTSTLTDNVYDKSFVISFGYKFGK